MGYCNSCGAAVPDGQGNCSMCYGDPYHGKDGYYLEYLKEQEREAQRKKQLEEEHMKELQRQEVLRQQKIEEETELLEKFYNYSMDNFNGMLKEEAIYLFIEERHAES